MPIFPVLELEALVQAGDKTRLDARKSFASGGSTITKVEITPGADAETVDITTDMYLDWAFTQTDGATEDPEEFEITLTVTEGTGADATEYELVKTIEVISESEDKLFSTDDMLRVHEPDILRSVPEGRATFKDVHRRAKGLMLAWLDAQGFIDDYGDKITEDGFVVPAEVEEWSTRVALRLIFEGLRSSSDDVFALKAKAYAKEEEFFRNRAVLRLDLNGDGVVSEGEELEVKVARVVRR